jgi:hypothetical protein
MGHRSYSFKEISHDDYGNRIETITEVTEYDVLDLYWDQWYDKKVKEVGEGHHSITKEHCIKEWVLMVDAWEST